VIFDPNDEHGAHALERLAIDRIGWLTRVTPGGQPQTMPIWFVWQDDELLIYSDHRAKRNASLAANPKVSFPLGSDAGGGDLVIILGEAQIDPSSSRLPNNEAYLAQYGDWIEASYGGPEGMAVVYNVPIQSDRRRGSRPGAEGRLC
jgi:PPOX class probable F420-dependent enzyme